MPSNINSVIKTKVKNESFQTDWLKIFLAGDRKHTYFCLALYKVLNMQIWNKSLEGDTANKLGHMSILSRIVQITEFFDFLGEYCEEKSETFTEF